MLEKQNFTEEEQEFASWCRGNGGDLHGGPGELKCKVRGSRITLQGSKLDGRVGDVKFIQYSEDYELGRGYIELEEVEWKDKTNRGDDYNFEDTKRFDI